MSCGLRTFEAVRFPLDGKYSQFDDALEFLADIQEQRRCGGRIAAFAMGPDGVEEATRHHELFDEIHVPCFVSDSYAQYAFGNWNWNCSLHFIESTLELFHGTSVEVTVGLGTSFGCPIRRTHSILGTIERLGDLVTLGVNSVMLGDTAGTATPSLVMDTFQMLNGKRKPKVLRVHFHNTFGKALLNSYTAIAAGANAIDASLLGLGGEPHPYFVNPTMVDNGNCATEEVFEFLEAEADTLSEDKSALFETARWFASHLPGEIPCRSAFAEFVP
jgi:hydroxymethylglutaryl-CoA lyase